MTELSGQVIAAGLSLGHTAIAYAVPFLFVLTFVVFFHELGHFGVARLCGVTVETFSIGFGRPLLSWKDRKGTVWKIGWLPLGGYVKFLGDEGAASAPDREKLAAMEAAAKASGGSAATSLQGVFHLKPLWQRAAVVVAGPIANFILAVIIFAALFMIFGEERVPPIVGAVVADTPAARAGFEAGDRIVEIEGRAIGTFSDISEIVSMNGGEALTVEVVRDGRRLALNVVPEIKIERDRFGNEYKLGRIGLSSVSDPSLIEHRRYGPFTAVGKAVGRVEFIVSQTVQFLGRLVEGRADTSQLSGPLGIAKTSGEMAQISLEALFSLIAIISVSVGFINLFPIPLLDGGHLLYYGVEAVRGRPLGERAQEFGFRLGLVLVISLMVFATWNDLVKLRPNGAPPTEETR